MTGITANTFVRQMIEHILNGEFLLAWESIPGPAQEILAAMIVVLAALVPLLVVASALWLAGMAIFGGGWGVLLLRKGVVAGWTGLTGRGTPGEPQRRRDLKGRHGDGSPPPVVINIGAELDRLASRLCEERPPATRDPTLDAIHGGHSPEQPTEGPSGATPPPPSSPPKAGTTFDRGSLEPRDIAGFLKDRPQVEMVVSIYEQETAWLEGSRESELLREVRAGRRPIGFRVPGVPASRQRAAVNEIARKTEREIFGGDE